MDSTKKAVVFLSEGFEEVEALTPVDYLRRAGCTVITVAVPPAKTVNHPCSIDDMPSYGHIVVSSHCIPVIADKTIDEFLADEKELADLVFLPGGMPGSTNLAASKEVCDYVLKMNEKGKIVSAICAAPVVVLGKLGLLKGKKYTCYTGMENDAQKFCGENYKALFEGSLHTGDVPAVKSGNIITGKGAGAAAHFALALVEALFGEDAKKKLHERVCQF